MPGNGWIFRLVIFMQIYKIYNRTLGKDGLTVSTDEFKITQKGKAAYSSFIIIRNEPCNILFACIALTTNEYSALWMRCTHQGTELQASGDFLQCPAHGSEFNNKGGVTNGPAR